MGNEMGKERKLHERLQKADRTGILQASSMKLKKLYEIRTPLGQSLRHIDLSRNSIVIVPREFFASVPNVRYLNLNSNRIEILPNMELLQKLEQLFIRENRLSQAPSNLSNSLKQMDASFNRIKSLYPLLQLNRLEELEMESNRLNEIPDEICRLSALVKLNVKNNQIVRLSPLIGKCSNLRIINLDSNSIHDFPEKELLQKSELCQITGLESNKIAKPINEMIGYDEYVERQSAQKRKAL